jgi:hypothetical protein
MSHCDAIVSRRVIRCLDLWRPARRQACRTAGLAFEARSMAAIFCGFLFTAAAHAQDFQWWSEFDLAGSTRTVDVLAPFLARLDPSALNPQLVATGVTADLRVSRHFTLTGGYLFAGLPQRGHLHVDIPLVAASTTVRVGRLVIADRNRLERLIGFGASPVRYRNRVFIDLPLGEEGRWHMFGDNEVFFDLAASRWSQNRFQVGGGARVGPGVSLDVFYLRRTLIGGAPDTHVLGTTVKVVLRRVREEGR